MIVHWITSEVHDPSMYSDMELEVIRTHKKSLPFLQKGITSPSGINTFDAGFDTNINKVDAIVIIINDNVPDDGK